MTGKYAIRVILIGSIYAILYYAYNRFSLTGSLKLPAESLPSFSYILVFILLASFGGSWLISLLKSRLDLTGKAASRFVIMGALSITWLSLLSIIGGWLYKFLFLQNMAIPEVRETYPGFIAQGLIIAIFTALIFAVLDHSLGTNQRLQQRQLELKKLSTEQLNLRFETLRNQISPHFLFNSLNTISSLIYRDVKLAEKFIRHLASVYQSVMENYNQPLISLDRELAFVEHYSCLMQVRFESAFYLDIESPENPEKHAVPPPERIDAG